MKVFLSGGGGFIGQYVISKLVEKGHSVRCLFRHLPTGKFVKNLEYVLGDLSDANALKNGLRDAEVVLHLAGTVFEQSWSNLYRVNSIGTKNIYAAACSTNVKRFVYLSSIAAVGPSRDRSELTESTTPHPISKYGRSKFLGEKFIQELHAKKEIETVILRPSLVYGAGANPMSRIAILIKTLQKKTFRLIGDGRNYISLCYVNDLASFIECIASEKLPNRMIEFFNVCDDEKMTMVQLVELICDHLQLEFPNKKMPEFAARIIAIYFELVRKFVAAPELVTQERVSEILGDWNISNNKAKKYGYQQTRTLKNILTEVINSF